MKVHGKEVQANIKNARLIDLRRRQIIEGAMHVFAAKGFHRATVREIADALGYSLSHTFRLHEDALCRMEALLAREGVEP